MNQAAALADANADSSQAELTRTMDGVVQSPPPAQQDPNIDSVQAESARAMDNVANGPISAQEGANTDKTQNAPVPTVNGALKYQRLKDRPIKLKEEPVENFRPMRVICIGAGYSGIYVAIRIPERLRNVDLTVYEKNPDVGGTWYENRYPGCACDIPAHSYQYSFDPNPNWSNFYAPAVEIHAYLKGIAQKYSTDRFIKCNHKVVACTWNQDRGRWRVTVENLGDGTKFDDEADVLINARGVLNNISWPEIGGLSSFQGKLLHSAAWDQEYDFTNKRIGVIGAGSSAIQIVPSLQRIPGTQISSFQRGRTWISPAFGDHAMEQLRMDHEDFRPEDFSKWIQDPVQFLKFRKLIEQDGNAIHPSTLKGTDIQKAGQQYMEENMRKRLAKKPEIADHILPSFAPGCRRLTPGVGYLEALCEDNVEYIPTGIKCINPDSITLVDGRTITLDALVCATGFQTSAPPPFPMHGIDGLSIAERWHQQPESYLSIATDAFPNHFMMLGPNAGIGAGSLTVMIETYGDYIIKCIRKMQKEDIKTMEVKRKRVNDFSSLCREYFKRTVYMDECRSWYRSEHGKGDTIIYLWPGSTLHCIETLRSPRWEDFEYEYLSQDGLNAGEEPNLLRWLGNGYSDLILNGGDLAWYLEPELNDIPAHPKPENTKAYATRVFSH